MIAKITLYMIGVVFGMGLMMAGMSQRSKIFGFLQLNSSWDPSLLFVLMTGVLLNLFTFNLINRFMYVSLYLGKSQLTATKLKTLMEKLTLDSLLELCYSDWVGESVDFAQDLSFSPFHTLLK